MANAFACLLPHMWGEKCLSPVSVVWGEVSVPRGGAKSVCPRSVPPVGRKVSVPGVSPVAGGEVSVPGTSTRVTAPTEPPRE